MLDNNSYQHSLSICQNLTTKLLAGMSAMPLTLLGLHTSNILYITGCGTRGSGRPSVLVLINKLMPTLEIVSHSRAPMDIDIACISITRRKLMTCCTPVSV